MEIKFAHSIVFVQDIEVSKKFYCDALGMKIEQDHTVFVLFEGHFAIHQAREIHQTIFGEVPASANEPQGSGNQLIYFETDDIEESYRRVSGHAQIIHPVQQQAWGQRVFRFYDPDHHLVEIGEKQLLQF